MTTDLAKPFLETLELWTRAARSEEVLRALEVLILATREHFRDSERDQRALDDMVTATALLWKGLTPTS